MVIRALELYCGIGGFAAAVAQSNVRVTGALDQSEPALSVYRLNFPEHSANGLNLERITGEYLASFEADFWWLSPPCQPHTTRGEMRDLADPRAGSYLRLLEVFPSIPEERLPAHIALENVIGYRESEARSRLLDILRERDYRLQERALCPIELGIPMRRPRYYLTASRRPVDPSTSLPGKPMRSLKTYVDSKLSNEIPGALRVSSDIVSKYGQGLHVLDPDDPLAYTTCFTSAYGRSLMHSGAYLRCGKVVRRFSPDEIAGLLHLPDGFRFPDRMSIRKRWQLVGNSLSVAAVREVLRAFPDIVFT